MKIAKGLVSVVVVAVVAFVAWNFLFGPLRYQRDVRAFAASLETCEPFSQPIAKLQHTIDKLDDGRCTLRMATLGPHEIRCTLSAEDLPVIAQGFADLADRVDMFGGTELLISTSDPDPLTQMLNSDACATVAL
jgi:hypothetical protein